VIGALFLGFLVNPATDYLALVIGGDAEDGHDDDIHALVSAPAEGDSMDLGAADFDSNQAFAAMVSLLQSADPEFDMDTVDWGDTSFLPLSQHGITEEIKVL